MLQSSSQAMAHPARQRRRLTRYSGLSSNNFDLTPASLGIDLCRSAAPSRLFLRSGSTGPGRDSQPHAGGNMKSRILTWSTATFLFVALAIPLRLAAQGQN